MSMNIPTGEGPRPDSPIDDHETLLRLRSAEATIESLLDALRHQETLVNDLSAATEGWAQAQQAVARADQELPAARRAAGWRGLARAGKRRLRRLWAGASPRPAPERRGASGDGELLSSEGDKAFVWTDARYGRWIELYDTLDEARRKTIMDALAQVGQPPLISVVLPVYNPPEDFLRQAIDSVRGQLYTNWELCIADDCSTLPHVAKVLDEYAALDERILVHHRASNGHISECSNSAVALAMAPGSASWITTTCWPSMRSPWRCWPSNRIPTQPFCTATKITSTRTGTGESHTSSPTSTPFSFWARTTSLICACCARNWSKRVGGFRVGYEGSQDWDLVLRVLEHVRPEQVVHLPHVLYHWRAHAESTASSVSAKPYVVEASRLVVEEHLERIGVEARITTIWGTSYNRVSWSLPQRPPKVSVIVLPRHGERLRRCVESIRILTPYPELEVIVLDDGGFRPPMRQMFYRTHGLVDRR